MTYWQKQQFLQQQRLLDEGIDWTKLQLTKAYTRCAENVISDMEDLYLEMLDEGEISLGYLYQQDRYYKMLGNINKNLRALGAKEITTLDSGVLDLAGRTYEFITSTPFPLVSKTLVEEAAKRAWCSDSMTYSDRIWKHKAELQAVLQQDLMDCVIQGKSHKHLVKDLRHKFGVAEHQAECIARTELNYIQNQAAMRGYIDAGYQMYQFISAIDDRTCDECGELNGQVFMFSEAEEGINFPPMHPNCRSNIIGYKELG